MSFSSRCDITIATLALALFGTLIAVTEWGASTDAIFSVAVIGGVACSAAAALICRTSCPNCGLVAWRYPFSHGTAFCSRCAKPENRMTIGYTIVMLGLVTLAWIVGAAANACVDVGVRWAVTPATVVDVISSGPGGFETCYRKDLVAVPNRAGEVAILRTAFCPGHDVVALSYPLYVVFVHRAGDNNSRDNLVFEYVPGEIASAYTAAPGAPWTSDSLPPRVAWISNSVLWIRTDDTIMQAVAQKSHVDGIVIEYDFAGGPPRSWEAKLRGASEIR